MQILIAPNAFKNSLAAGDVALAIKEGFEQSKLQCKLLCFPVGDGGDGTGELIVQHCNGVNISTIVHDPLGRKIPSSFGLIEEGKTAVIEMANASGLRLLSTSELSPLRANSYGTGELIVQALSKGMTKIIMCIGGSATIDGAVGMLQALGFHFLNKHGNELSIIPRSLVELNSIEFPEPDKRMNYCKIIVLCDVENFLLGAEGAAAVFGPQKGATPGDVKKLEASLTRLRDVVFRQTGKDMSVTRHGGAAGGVAAGLAALLTAEPVNGIEHFLFLTNFDKALENTDLVVTGEGSIDLQTLQGKGPFGVAKKAKEKGIPVIGLAGKVAVEKIETLGLYFDVLLSINNQAADLSDALSQTHQNLKKTAKDIGNLLAQQGNFDKSIFRE